MEIFGGLLYETRVRPVFIFYRREHFDRMFLKLLRVCMMVDNLFCLGFEGDEMAHVLSTLVMNFNVLFCRLCRSIFASGRTYNHNTKSSKIR